MVNRIFDVALATLMLALTLPFLVMSTLAVWLTSEGPVLFAHRRCGRHGIPFRCLKFRTMVVDAENWLVRYPDLGTKYKENGFKLKSDWDPRVTKVGRILRRAHLDELPQLLNVIRGDMSLVGPRPIVEEELNWYGNDKDEYLSVRPGVFGAWTAQGRQRVDYPARTLVELGYIRDNFWLKDLRVLLKHIPVLLLGQVEDQLPLQAEMAHKEVNAGE
jgi:lipopolysaccharide/colanic/teichoic acid biosynthesis glycosyltransferase